MTLIVKTEYWGAFPETEIELLKQGFYLAYITNANRRGTDEDLDRKARFVKNVINKYELNDKCVSVGMSCGGLIAVKFAAKYPELTACIYIDAPVINYMSCPCRFGIAERSDDENFSEILGALGLKSISELICYRDTPQDKIPDLIKNKIPVVMVAGDRDVIVPYIENGILIENAYKQTDIDIEIYIKKGCNHHPHGLDDPTPVIDFIKNHLHKKNNTFGEYTLKVLYLLEKKCLFSGFTKAKTCKDYCIGIIFIKQFLEFTFVRFIR